MIALMYRSFDITILEAKKTDVKMAALTRLQTWLNLMDSVRPPEGLTDG